MTAVFQGSPRVNYWIVPPTGHDYFLLHAFQFIITNPSSYHPTLYIVDTESVIKQKKKRQDTYIYTRLVQMKPAQELLSEGVAATTTVSTSTGAGTHQATDLLRTELPGFLLTPLHHCSFDVFIQPKSEVLQNFLKGDEHMKV
jgi:hypothetical protein